MDICYGKHVYERIPLKKFIFLQQIPPISVRHHEDYLNQLYEYVPCLDLRSASL